MRADSEDPESYTPPSFLSLSFPFLMFHSYLGTLLYYSFFFFFFFRLSYVLLYSPVALYFHAPVYCRVPAYPRISLSPRFLLFFLLSSPPCLLYSTVPACFIFLYLPSLFFDIPATGPTIFVPLVSVQPTWSSLHLPSSFLSQNLSFSLCVHVYIPHSSSVLHPILVIFISHKFNPTSLRLAPYTFHCSIKRPTRICTRVYTMNSVVVQKANRIRVGHDTS